MLLRILTALLFSCVLQTSSFGGDTKADTSVDKTSPKKESISDKDTAVQKKNATVDQKDRSGNGGKTAEEALRNASPPSIKDAQVVEPEDQHDPVDYDSAGVLVPKIEISADAGCVVKKGSPCKVVISRTPVTSLRLVVYFAIQSTGLTRGDYHLEGASFRRDDPTGTSQYFTTIGPGQARTTVLVVCDSLVRGSVTFIGGANQPTIVKPVRGPLRIAVNTP